MFARFREPLIDSAAHLRHIFSRLLLAEKLDVHPVHLAFFAIADEKICTESAPPHSISVSLIYYAVGANCVRPEYERANTVRPYHYWVRFHIRPKSKVCKDSHFVIKMYGSSSHF